ncbi:M1 family aminopeptidase [Methanolobus psychrotolerans]|uniref:M1 family aminopeptidase n=1 Tax=Methanolobus psychrotolerans TaxID=1874706 RepID=UPI00101AEB77|nr:M1 family aminopeptidase [Methanolobus psychrotolerans]
MFSLIVMGKMLKNRILAGTILLILFLCTIHTTVAGSNAISTEITSSYKLVPDEGIVKVSKEITFFNNDTGTKFWRGYYSNYNYYLPEGAMNIEAYDNENPMACTRSPDGYYVFYFNQKVWYEESYTFHIDYELEINRNTAVFSLSEYGDNIEVTLEVPSDFDTYIGREDYKIEEKMYSSIYKFEKGQKWDKSYVVNSVRVSPRQILTGTASLQERNVDIEVRYWEGEEQWAQDVMSTTVESLTLLEEKWGFAYPADYNITITQANITETGGYGGYNEGRNGIWLLYTSNHGILIHELAHYWTRACNFDQLWMDEGYADLYTYIVMSETEPEEAVSRRDRFFEKYESLKDEHDFPLSDWSTPQSIDHSTEERVDFGYKKAFALTFTLYDTMGIDTLQAMNQKFINYGDDIDNSDYLTIVNSVSSQDTSFIETYLYA